MYNTLLTTIEDSVATIIKMIQLNEENGAILMAAAEEMMESGQLWIDIMGESFYVPELIEQITLLFTFNKLNNNY